MPSAAGVDAIILAVPHRFYQEFDFCRWMEADRPTVLDAFAVLSADRRAALRALGCRVESIGRGVGL
jgi:hypothetical protein